MLGMKIGLHIISIARKLEHSHYQNASKELAANGCMTTSDVLQTGLLTDVMKAAWWVCKFYHL